MVSVSGNVGQATTKKINGKNGETTVLDFSVAENLRTPKGEKMTNWYKVSIFGKYAETMSKYIAKGTLVQVYGDLNPRLFDKRDGGQGLSLDIMNPVISLLGGGSKGGDAGNAGGEAAKTPAPAAGDDDGFVTIPDGVTELPFA